MTRTASFLNVLLKPRSALALAAILLSIMGCANRGSVPVPLAQEPAAALNSISSPLGHAVIPSTKSPSGTIYVSGRDVNVYAPESNTPTLTIRKGIGVGGHLAVGPSGDLYSANGGPRDITVYAPGSTSVLLTVYPYLNGGGWFLIGVDTSEYLYALSYWTQCTRFSCTNKALNSVYAPGKTTPLRSLAPKATPASLTFDSRRNLYVGYGSNYSGGNGWVDVYAPRLSAKLRRIRLRSGAPFDLATDTSGTLYVDAFSRVEEYAAGSATLLRAIKHGVYESAALAVDRSNVLYVANGPSQSQAASVTVFAPGTTTVQRTITAGIINPIHLTTDHLGRLYVLNGEYGGHTGSVAVYERGALSPERTITAGVSHPFDMTVQP